MSESEQSTEKLEMYLQLTELLLRPARLKPVRDSIN